MTAFATSYIKTSTAAATRLADSASITGTNFSQWYNQTEGTFVSISDTISITAQNQGIFAVGNPSLAFGAAETIYALYTSSLSGRITDEMLDGGASQLPPLVPLKAQTANTMSKHALAYRSNDCASTTDAVAVVTDSSATIPTPTGLSIGSLMQGWSGATTALNGHIQRLSYYRARLSNASLQSLST